MHAIHAYLFRTDSSYDRAEHDPVLEAAPDLAFDWDQVGGAIWREIALHFVEVDERRLRQGPAWGRREVARYGFAEYGFSPAMSCELLRIGRALLELPRIHQALVDGFLVWPDIAVLTRVAVPRTEAVWLETALALPLEQLEPLVARSVRGWAPPKADATSAAEQAPAPEPSSPQTPAPRRRHSAPRWAVVRARRRPSPRSAGATNRLHDTPDVRRTPPDVRHPSRAPPPSG